MKKSKAEEKCVRARVCVCGVMDALRKCIPSISASLTLGVCEISLDFFDLIYLKTLWKYGTFLVSFSCSLSGSNIESHFHEIKMDVCVCVCVLACTIRALQQKHALLLLLLLLLKSLAQIGIHIASKNTDGQQK